jgi:hypothetical protein
LNYPAGKLAGLALGKLNVQHFLDCFELATNVNEAGSSVFRGERLHLGPDLLLANTNKPESWLEANGVYFKEERTKLAFVCLLTAVGIPMIFAGEEFCDPKRERYGVVVYFIGLQRVCNLKKAN